MERSPSCLLFGAGRNVVDKAQWRDAATRSSHFADVCPLTVNQVDVDEFGRRSSGCFVLSEQGGRWLQSRVRLDPFVIEEGPSGDLELLFTGRSLMGRPKRSERTLGPIELEMCVEIAINLRWQSEWSQTKYLDHVWRFHRASELAVGSFCWPTAKRVIDLRKVLY